MQVRKIERRRGGLRTALFRTAAGIFRKKDYIYIPKEKTPGIMMKIAIVGTGYVGLVSGACFAEMGLDITCVDIDAEKIEGLNAGVIPIYEPGLEELVRRNVEAGRLHFTTDLTECLPHVEVVFSAVGTPPDEDGSADLKYVLDVARTFGRHIRKYTVLVTKSTVPVGTAQKVRAVIEEELEKRGCKVPFDVASNPEFLKEGAAIKDFMSPDRVVVGVDSERARKLMAKLYKTTPLEDSFSCNFNVLVSGQPRVMGVREILKEWTAFRVECVRRRTYYDLHGKEKRLHLLQGLAAILLDIDKAIHIIRTTEEETEVVPNLMIGFGIDEVQADYVAEIKLRHLNREYILKRTGEIEQLEKDIADLNDVLAKPARIRRIIINELNDVAKKYGKPRCSEILYDLPEEDAAAEEEAVPDYPVTVFFTREGYFKKIPPQSLRTAGAHKLKEGDEIIQQLETRNNVEALFFTDKQQVYKVRLAELEDGKVAQMGIFIPGRLGMDEGENVLSMVITGDYSGFMLFFFASGKCAKIPLSSYATKQNRRKLLKAYCDKEPLAKLFFLPEETELAIRTSASRMLLVGTAQIAAKTTRDSQGVAVVTLKKNQTIASVVPADTLELANPHRYRVRSLPATGALIRAEDEGEQMSLL